MSNFLKVIVEVMGDGTEVTSCPSGVDVEIIDQRTWPKDIDDSVDYWDDEDDEWSYSDWQIAVAEGDTRAGYWEWAAAQKEMAAA